MGEVYLARDLRLDRTIALKILPHELAGDSSRLQRFNREAKAAASLNHPNICTIYEVGSGDGRSFISMEYVDGISLRDRIARSALEISEVIDFAIQMTDALEEARKKNIVHRDIKSTNILITEKNQIKLLDFGLARYVITDPQQSSEASTESHLTESGVVLGTVAYMSPEQALGKSVDHRSDLFSFGVVLYEMLTGQLPFKGKSTTELLDALLHHDPPSVARYNDKAPDPFIRLVNKLLEKDQDERYQTAQDVWIDLRRIKKEVTGLSGSQPVVARRTVPLRWVLAAAVVLVVFTGVTLWMSQREVNVQSKPIVKDKSIAVLPFKNMTGDPQWDYFGTGLADAINGGLASSPELIVRPISAVLAQENPDPLQVARALAVDHVVDGLFQKSGDLIRVSVHLLNATTGALLWTDEIRCNTEEVFSLQQKIAMPLASALRVKVAGHQGLQATEMTTRSSEAYFYYLKARQNHISSMRTWSSEKMKEAELLLKHALELDPDYAAAHAQLSVCLLVLVDSGIYTDPKYVQEGLKHAHRAAQLAPDLAEAHMAVALAYSYMGQEYLEEQYESLKRALRLEPNNQEIFLKISGFCVGLGLKEELFKHLTEMERLNPKEFWPTRTRGFWNLFHSNYPAAIREFEKYREREPDDATVLTYLALAYAGNGEKEKASKTPTEMVPLVKALLFAMLNERNAAIALLDKEAEEVANLDPVFAYYLASTYSLLAEKDKAIRRIDRAIELGWLDYSIYEKDPNLNNLRSDPRFIEILSRLKTEWEANQKKYRF